MNECVWYARVEDLKKAIIFSKRSGMRWHTWKVIQVPLGVTKKCTLNPNGITEKTVGVFARQFAAYRKYFFIVCQVVLFFIIFYIVISCICMFAHWSKQDVVLMTSSSSYLLSVCIFTDLLICACCFFLVAVWNLVTSDKWRCNFPFVSFFPFNIMVWWWRWCFKNKNPGTRGKKRLNFNSEVKKWEIINTMKGVFHLQNRAVST